MMLSIGDRLQGAGWRLVSSATTGDRETLARLLDRFPNLAKSAVAEKALLKAIENKQGKYVFDLLQANPSLTKSESGKKGLSIASLKEDYGSICSYLKLCPELAKSKEVETVFMNAIKTKSGYKVKSLLEASPDLATSDLAKKALVLAAQNGGNRGISYLLEYNPALGKSEEAKEGLLLSIKSESFANVLFFLRANNDLIQTQDVSLPILKLMMRKISSVERVDMATKTLLEMILKAGKGEFQAQVSKIFAQKPDECLAYVEKIQKLEEKVCNNEYSALSFHYWLFHLVRDMVYYKVSDDREESSGASFKDVFPILEGIADIRSLEVKKTMSDELLKMVAGESPYKNWTKIAQSDLAHYSTPLGMFLLHFHQVHKS